MNDIKPEPQVLGVGGIESGEKVYDQPKNKKINPEVYSEYMKVQEKYIVRVTQYNKRVNLMRKERLARKVQALKTKLMKLSENLYISE